MQPDSGYQAMSIAVNGQELVLLALAHAAAWIAQKVFPNFISVHFPHR